ncbi:uncharacterized protein ATC70_010912 [Mucor velutinosus]|uniref:C3H1-type domain-containing protein n=1 Tax=Mucor velutinosus TaxID=708070 RepID=A0AAN7DFE1_9FUNG|nr:hypothetical protein ATC70_010912 [Mucor velutinosus]
MPLTTTTQPLAVALDQFNQGIQSVDDYQKYLSLLKHTEGFNPNVFDPLYKTVDNAVLKSIGESQEFGKVMKQIVDIACSSWNEDLIKAILKTMDYLPLDLDVLIKNSLGFGVKDIKKSGIEKNSTDIVDMTNALIEKWKVLQKKGSLNANGKRNSPDRASSTSPPSSTESPARKQIKLAIQKEPPTRPKAMADPNFLSSLRESKKYPITRPIYNVDKILEGFGSKPGKPTTENSLKRPESSSTSADADSSKRKRVRFKDNLVEIREYEKNPEEWTNFDTTGANVEHQYGNARDLDVKEGQIAFMHVPQIAWYTPLELQLDESPSSTLIVRTQIQTDEVLAQDGREKLALAAIYTSPQHIPPSPAEPDETPNPNADGSVPIIPLDDTDSLPMNTIPTSSSPVSTLSPPRTSVMTPSTLQPNLITPANLSAAAAAIAAMKDTSSFMIPQQSQVQAQQPQYTSSVVAASPPVAPQAHYYNQPYNAALQNTAQPTAIGSLGQPKINNQNVNEMLEKNPSILQTLKELSFLATGNMASNANNAVPQQQIPAPPQSAYQPAQPYHPYQRPPPSNTQQFQQNDWNRSNNNGTQNRQQQQQQQQQQLQRKKAKARNQRGRGNRGGSHGQGRNNARVCSFYNSPDGCRNGDSCGFLHEHPN